MITVTGLEKSFGDLRAVAGVSCTIARGETFGLLGPNGAGKSTTIQIMVGAQRPDAGQVEVDGLSDPSRPEVRKRIGYAPQSIALYDKLTAEENLRFFGTLYGMPRARLEERIDWCLGFAGLQDRRKSRTGTFSGGMQRRLNLACALVHEPQVVFLDEPTAGVDPQSRNHLFECIEQLAELGRTIVYTTHYMEEAERLCDRVAIMDHGKVLALDTVDRLIEAHGGTAVVEARGGGEIVRVETKKPLEEVARLANTGKVFDSIELKRPDLESVFLALTGRRLRDA